MPKFLVLSPAVDGSVIVSDQWHLEEKSFLYDQDVLGNLILVDRKDDHRELQRRRHFIKHATRYTDTVTGDYIYVQTVLSKDVVIKVLRARRTGVNYKRLDLTTGE